MFCSVLNSGRRALVRMPRALCTTQLLLSPNSTSGLIFVCLKHTLYNGVKGIRNRKSFFDKQGVHEVQDEEAAANDFNLVDRTYDEVASEMMNVTIDHHTAQNVLVIQPYIKWGTKKNTETTPDQQLEEAEALIHSLPNWSVGLSLKVPLETLERKALFGSGKMDELKALVKQHELDKPLTCVFISKGTLSFVQKRTLESVFGIPVMDRYSVVIQILRLHATTAEARLQVAMAEIPYIWTQAKDANMPSFRRQGCSLTDTQREVLRTREKKLKLELERIRGQRHLLRKKRKNANYPVVAVVGYTNAGKTSLIKVLSNEITMQPRDQMFATLDVTAHAGMLPCNLEVIYMDTVGFMSDLPTGLIECFVATLEDAMLADVLLHVQDLSHDCYKAQTKHVETTLEALARNISSSTNATLPPIINVGNKVDLLPPSKAGELSPKDLLKVSAKTGCGVHTLLLEIEQQILTVTGRKKIWIRVQSGGNEMAWLHKNAAVTSMRACEKSAEHIVMNVVISEQKMQQFKKHFCQ